MIASSTIATLPRGLFLTLGVLILQCCNSTKVENAQSSIEFPRTHQWQYITTFGQEVDGYATYSYILVARNHVGEAWDKYLLLKQEIINTTANSAFVASLVNKDLVNVFVILKNDEANSEGNLNHLFLNILATQTDLDLTNPGPYIVTLSQDLSGGSAQEQKDLMFVDLTNVHSLAIPELVSTYKNHVESQQIEGIQKLNSIKLHVLNLALITDDAISFAKAAYAATFTSD
jgi:hypothetical protein